MNAAETAGIDGSGHVPGLVVALGFAVPDHASIFAGLGRGLRKLDRMDLFARRAFCRPLLLVAVAIAGVLDVAGLGVHDRRLAHVVDFGPADFLKFRDASDGVRINILPTREPDLVIDLEPNRLRLLG